MIEFRNEEVRAATKARLDERSRQVGDCIEYTGSLNFGYGSMRVEGVRTKAHRWAYMVANGPIPDDLIVRHKCDNRACINADHLELGTYADNGNDMSVRGRSLFGTRHKKAKFTEETARYALIQMAAGKTQVALSEELGIAQPTISSLSRNRTWKHISRDLDKEVAA